MWRQRLSPSSVHHKWIVTVGGVVTGVAAVWFCSALATPIKIPPRPMLHMKGRPGGVVDARFDAGVLSAEAASPLPAQVFEQLTPDQAAAANAKVAISNLPNPPARPFKLAAASLMDRNRAQTCLAMAVYYEAGTQGPEGEAAVAQVVLNRVRHPIFPKTVCGVVFQGSTLPTGCQFTFTCDGSLSRRPSVAGWKSAMAVAESALNGHVEKSVGEATHYHTIWVVPYWQPSVVKLAQLQAHIFYRWPGGMGEPAAFSGLYAGGETAPPAIPGFDTGLPTVMVAQLQDKTPAPVVSAASAPAPVAAATPPVQVAALTTVPPPSIAAIEAASKKPDYYGVAARRARGGSAAPW
jgi:spore germination cell wall hydrolase CwlJ-like protein